MPLQTRSWSRAATLVLAASVAGCDSAPLEITHETEHFEIGTDFDQPVCGGNLWLIEEQAAFVAHLLGGELDDDKIPVYWYEWYTDIEDCREGAAACLLEGEVFTSWRSMSHELVHAVADELLGQRTPLFAEGLAVMLSGKVLKYPDLNLSDVIEQERISSVDYEGVGHFTRWLVDTYGIDAYLMAYDAAEWSKDIAASQEEALQLAYGKSWRELLDEYERDAPDFTRGMGPFDICAVDTLPWDGERWAHTIAVDCEDDSTIAQIGNLNGPEMWRRVAFEISETGYYLFEFSGNSTAAIFTTCMAKEVAAESELSWGDWKFINGVWQDTRSLGLFQWVGWPAWDGLMPNLPVELWFPPGRYVLWVGTRGEEAVDISVELERVP